MYMVSIEEKIIRAVTRPHKLQTGKYKAFSSSVANTGAIPKGWSDYVALQLLKPTRERSIFHSGPRLQQFSKSETLT